MHAHNDLLHAPDLPLHAPDLPLHAPAAARARLLHAPAPLLLFLLSEALLPLLPAPCCPWSCARSLPHNRRVLSTQEGAREDETHALPQGMRVNM